MSGEKFVRIEKNDSRVETIFSPSSIKVESFVTAAGPLSSSSSSPYFAMTFLLVLSSFNHSSRQTYEYSSSAPSFVQCKHHSEHILDFFPPLPPFYLSFLRSYICEYSAINMFDEREYSLLILLCTQKILFSWRGEGESTCSISVNRNKKMEVSGEIIEQNRTWYLVGVWNTILSHYQSCYLEDRNKTCGQYSRNTLLHVTQSPSSSRVRVYLSTGKKRKSLNRCYWTKKEATHSLPPQLEKETTLSLPSTRSVFVCIFLPILISFQVEGTILVY